MVEGLIVFGIAIGAPLVVFVCECVKERVK